MREKLKIFLCVLLSCTMFVANTNYSLADQIDEYSLADILNANENEVSVLEGNDLLEDVIEMQSTEADINTNDEQDTVIGFAENRTEVTEEITEVCSDECTEDASNKEELAEEEILTEQSTEEFKGELIDNELSADLNISLIDEEEKDIVVATHVPNDITNVFDTYLMETNKEVTVKYGSSVETYKGNDIYLDLSKTDISDLDKYVIEFSLNYYMKETDSVDPASRYIQGGDYFFVNIPKYMEPHMSTGNVLNLKFEQNGEEIIIAKAEIVSFLADDYKIKITLTDAVGVNDFKNWFNINFGCKFWVTINKEKIQETIEKSETIDISGMKINIKYPEKESTKPTTISKSGTYDKNNNTVNWTISIDKDSVSKSLLGWTLSDSMDVSNQTIKSISILTYGNTEKKTLYDASNNIVSKALTLHTTDGNEIDGISYTFDAEEKSPCYVYIETEPKNDVFINQLMDMNEVTFQNKSVSLYKENDFISAEPAFVSYKGDKVIKKKGIASNAASIKWTISINEEKNEILGKANVKDTLDKDLELVDGTLKVDNRLILDKTNEDKVFGVKENAYYVLDVNSGIETIVVYFNDDALNKTSHVIEFETKLKYDAGAYDQNQREVENSATINLEKYGKSQTDTIKATYNKDTNIHYYEIKKSGKFYRYDLSIVWLIQPSTVSTNNETLKDVIIIDTIDLSKNGQKYDRQELDESTIKFYVAGIEKDKNDIGVDYTYNKDSKQIIFNFEKTTLSTLDFNKLEISYKTVITNIASKSVKMLKKTNYNYQVYSYYNDVVIRDNYYESHINTYVLASSNLIDKTTESYFNDDQLGFKYSIKINQYSYPINGGIKITDNLNNIDYKYYDSKTNEELNPNKVIKPIFEVEKIYIYRDKELVDNISYNILDGIFTMNLEPEEISHHVVDVVMYAKIANKDEFFKQNIIVSPTNSVEAQIRMNNPDEVSSKIIFVDDTGVKLTQKLVEKVFDNQEFDALTGDTYANYSVTINQKAVSLGDVSIIDVLGSKETEFVPDSIKLYKLGHTITGEISKTNMQEVLNFTKIISNDKDGFPMLTVGIKNCKDSYKLEYKVKIIGQSKTVTLTNNVKLEGKSISGDVQDVIKTDITTGQNGWADAKQKAIVKIVKTDSDTKSLLQGVSFGLYKKDQPDTLISEKITDKNGNIVFYVDFETEYVIKETKSLEGYILENRQYVISKGDLVQGKKEILVLEVENKKIPKTETPSTEAPSTEVPSTEIPSEEVPKTDTPPTTPSNNNSNPPNKELTILDDDIPLVSTIPEESIEPTLSVDIDDEDVPLVSNIKTGDNSKLGWWFAIMIAAIIVFVRVTFMVEKEKENEE